MKQNQKLDLAKGSDLYRQKQRSRVLKPCIIILNILLTKISCRSAGAKNKECSLHVE